MRHSLAMLIFGAFFLCSPVAFGQDPFQMQFVSITPAVDGVSGFDNDTTDEVYLFAFDTVQGTTYTVVFSTNEEPGAVLALGGDVACDDYVYDSAGGTVTIQFTAASLKTVDLGDLQLTAFGFTPVDANDNDRSPVPGIIASSDVLDGEIKTPDNDETDPTKISLGFILTGPKGESGFLRMCIPSAYIQFLDSLTSASVTAENLAFYKDSKLVSRSVIANDDGSAEFNMRVVFRDGANVAFDRTDDESFELANSFLTPFLTKGGSTSRYDAAPSKPFSAVPRHDTVQQKREKLSLYAVLDNAALGASLVRVFERTIVKKNGETKIKNKLLKEVSVTGDADIKVNLKNAKCKTCKYKVVAVDDNGESVAKTKMKVKRK